MTVARLQCVIVGVMRTVTVRRGEDGLPGREGVMAISGKETTAREPRDIGCSGSEIVETRSVHSVAFSTWYTHSWVRKRLNRITYHISPARQSAPRIHSRHYHYRHSRIHCCYTTSEERMDPLARGARDRCRIPSPHNIPVPPPVHFWPWTICAGGLGGRLC